MFILEISSINNAGKSNGAVNSNLVGNPANSLDALKKQDAILDKIEETRAQIREENETEKEEAKIEEKKKEEAKAEEAKAEKAKAKKEAEAKEKEEAEEARKKEIAQKEKIQQAKTKAAKDEAIKLALKDLEKKAALKAINPDLVKAKSRETLSLEFNQKLGMALKGLSGFFKGEKSDEAVAYNTTVWKSEFEKIKEENEDLLNSGGSAGA